MREERLQKKSVFVVKISEIIWIAVTTAMILFFTFPFAVFAQETDLENTETVFEDETETAPDITPVPDSDPDLDGFISGDDSSEKDNTIHVIIENGSAGNTDNSNTDSAGDGTMTGGDPSYGDVYSGSRGGETSSSGE